MTDFRVIRPDETMVKIPKGVWCQGPTGIVIICVRCASAISLESYMIQSDGNVGTVQCPVCAFVTYVHLTDWSTRR